MHSRISLRLPLILVGLALTAFVLTNYAGQSDWVPKIVDMVRGLPFVGPERVAAVEDMYYKVQDQWDQWYYRYTHPSSAPTGTEQTASKPSPTATLTLHSLKPITGTPESSPPRDRAPAVAISPRPLTPLLPDPQPGEGMWTSTDMPLGTRADPPLWHTFYRPDPIRPYARVDLVRIDLTQTTLSLVAGTTEPRPMDGIPGPGQIPLSVQKSGKLLAAWNGGFLTLHGAFGMMVNRRMILPPREGLATIALYEDGRIRLGMWGRDFATSPDLVSFRQNGPMLIDQGRVKGNDFSTWGKSVSGDTYIWRSGLGITSDGALVVAVGNPVSAQTLGEAMSRAGVVQAMQLDVNAWHVFLFTYELKPSGLVATKVNPGMPGGLQTFLKPYDRDFMYLTVK